MTAIKRFRLALYLTGLVICLGTVAGAGWAVRAATSDTPMVPAEAAVGVRCLGYVDLGHGVTSLYPARPGRVDKVLVAEGDPVSAGAELLRVDDRQARLQVQEAQAGLDAALVRLTQARKLPEQHRTRLAQQTAAVEAARRHLAAARHGLERKRDLQRIEQLSKREVEATTEETRALEAALEAEGQRLRELGLVDPADEMHQAEAVVAAARTRLEQARLALDECTVKAPEAGTVLRVLVAAGDVLGPQPQKPALVFCPAGPRLVRAEVEQEFAGAVAVGLEAVIEDDRAAGNKWRGRVERVSDWYTQRRTILPEPLQVNDVRTLECVIRLDPGQPEPRIGQRMRVTIGPRPTSR